MLNYEKSTKAELVKTLKTLQSFGSMDGDEREQLVHELQVHQIELEMQNQELRETQGKLEEASNLYVDLYDFAPVGYISLDVNGCIQEINLTAASMLGKERSRLLNLPFATYVFPGDLPQLRDHLWNCSQTRQKVTAELNLILEKGRLIPVQLSSLAIYDLKREVTLYRTAISDITERKRAEEELREARNYLDKLIQYANAPIIVWDPQLRITRFNRAFEHLSGYQANQVIGQELKFLFPAISRAESLGKINSDLQGNNWESVEIPVLRQDGTERLILWNSANIYAEDGQTLIATIAQGQDITGRKLAEQVLQKFQNELEIRVKERTAELVRANQALLTEVAVRKRTEENLAAETERLSVTLCSIGDGVITTNTEGKIVLINQIAADLTGWENEAACGKPIEEVFCIINGKTGAAYDDLVLTALKTGNNTALNIEIILVSRNGSEREITISGAPIRDTSGENIGMVLVFRDITQQRKMEEEILRTQKLESLGILAGGIAHDFNNFLAGIMASTQLSKMRLAKGMEVADGLDNIEKVVIQAAGLTKQLLTFSKGGAPVKKTASIAELIKDTVDFTLHGSNLRCEFSIPDDLWLVKVDEGQMSQVINNLVINAAQAMSEGGTVKVQVENIKVEAGHENPLRPGNYVKIAIVDHGVGIPEEHLRKIFDPYFTTKHNGNGLGLASAYTIVKKHNGHIAVQSALGVGTTFEIFLPTSKSKAVVKEQTPEFIIKGTGRILLMDDEANIRDGTGEILSQIGYEVALAKDGAEAIARYLQAKEAGAPFDVIITDLTIPGGMGGREAVAKLLAMDPEVKVIVSSGYSNDPVMADHRKYGFCDVVTKPYRIEELHQRLHNIIQGGS